MSTIASITEPPSSPVVASTPVATTPSASEMLDSATSPLSSGASSKKYSCTHCPQTFTRQHNLKSHLLIHSQEKKFTCDTCSSKFRRIHDLKRHLKLHTGERPYLCNKCGRRFARGDALIRHTKASGTCSVAFVSGDSKDEDMLDEQYTLPSAPTSPRASFSEVTEDLPHKRTSISNITNPPHLPSIVAAASKNAPADSTGSSSRYSTPSLSLPPISSPLLQSASSIPSTASFQRRESHYTEDRILSQFPSPTGNASEPTSVEEETKTTSNANPVAPLANSQITPSPSSLALFSQSIQRQSAPSPSNATVTSPMGSHRASEAPVNAHSISTLLTSHYPQRSSAGSSYVSPPSSIHPSEGFEAGEKGKSSESPWQIIRMLENRVRALEERLNSAEGRVSFLEGQLTNHR